MGETPRSSELDAKDGEHSPVFKAPIVGTPFGTSLRGTPQLFF